MDDLLARKQYELTTSLYKFIRWIAILDASKWIINLILLCKYVPRSNEIQLWLNWLWYWIQSIKKIIFYTCSLINKLDLPIPNNTHWSFVVPEKSPIQIDGWMDGWIKNDNNTKPFVWASSLTPVTRGGSPTHRAIKCRTFVFSFYAILNMLRNKQSSDPWKKTP